jgi:hypothetical protein
VDIAEFERRWDEGRLLILWYARKDSNLRPPA